MIFNSNNIIFEPFISKKATYISLKYKFISKLILKQILESIEIVVLSFDKI
jgi:hypothetical protein